MKKLLFINNPNAGSRKNPVKTELLKKQIDTSFEYKFITTKRSHHATQIVESEKNNYDSFVAIGGDGTVNEVGKALLHSNKTLGIIPTGSGNGLAFELGIKKSPFKAVKLLIQANEKIMDTLKINGRVCLNVAGVGFDANVAHCFEKYKRRGLFTYVYSTLRTMLNYKTIKLTIKLIDQVRNFEVFSISFANSRQFGNNAFIAPMARLDDGLMDIAIIHPFPFFLIPVLALRLFNKTLPKSKYYTHIKVKKVEILNEDLMKWHIDGEPIMIKGPVLIHVDEGSLRVFGK